MELTERESEILNYLSEGFTDEEIAKEINWSKHTVYHYVQMLRFKFTAKNRNQLVAKFMSFNIKNRVI